MTASAINFAVNPGIRILMLDAGLDPENILRRAGLPEDLFSRENASLNTGQYYAMWRAIEDDAEDSLFPIRLGTAISVESFYPPVFACFCSPNLVTGFHRLAQYKRLIGPIVLEVESSGEETTIAIHNQGDPLHIPSGMAIMELVYKVQLVRLATRSRIIPLQVTCTSPIQQIEDYTAWFGTRPRTGDRNSITFSAEDSRRPFLTENKAMWDYFEPELRKRLADMNTKAGTGERVRAALLEMLPGGQRNLDDVANRLAISKRSLQRRLKEEGQSFQGILNNVREDLARHYLKKSDLSGGEIAFLLGFEDPNSFFRAFHGWTGQTPESIRQGLMH